MRIALVGNPNSGKTSLFNALTGSNQSVGNWPGVTVEKKVGTLKKDHSVEIVDLPGIYSLSSVSLEEEITRDYLLQNKIDIILNIVDSSSLERSMYLTTQLAQLEIPMVVAMNMIDILERRKDHLDIEVLKKEFKIPFVPISITKNKGIKELISAFKDAKTPVIKPFNQDIQDVLKSLKNEITQEKEYPYEYLALKILEEDKFALTLPYNKEIFNQERTRLEKQYEDAFDSIIIHQRYDYIESIVNKAFVKNHKYESLSAKFDKVITNRFLAIPIFFFIMWIIYMLSISVVGDASLVLIEEVVASLQDITTTFLLNLQASEWLISLLVDGIMAGVGAVLGFIPQVLILFLCLSFLEDTGYMSRIAFIMDKIFYHLGLSGKSFIPMIIGTGCSVPGIMAVRTLENERDRKLTAIMTPFVPCGAKLPVFALFIAAFFPNSSFVAVSLYFISILVIILSALLLKKVLFKGEVSPYILELPNYKLPRLGSITRTVWEKVKDFIVRAGTIIFVGSILIWFLQSFNFQLQLVEDPTFSMLGDIGRFITPLFIPMGITSWELSVATLTGFVAKEQIVSTLAILVRTSEATLASTLSTLVTPIAGYSFMIFVLLASPCIAAIGALRSELRSTKWTIFALFYQTSIAYLLAVLIYQIGSRL